MRAAAVLAAALIAAATPAVAADFAERVGLYQWVGAAPDSERGDLLSSARRRTVELGLRVFRFYVGARFDYRRPYLDPRRFDGQLDGPAEPAAILGLPRYRAAIEDPGLATVILTLYSSADYGGGSDDVNLLRPWSSRESDVVERQLGAAARFLLTEYGDLDKTVIIANHETDEKLMEMLNYGVEPERAIETLASWLNARQEAIEAAREAFGPTRLRLFHAVEISTVNLRIGPRGDRFGKTARGEGWSALRDVLPRLRCDLISYSAYESANSPFETGAVDRDPAEAGERLRRDLDRIHEAARGSISDLGRARFGEKFVIIGELGFARERFEPLASGGVLPRLFHVLSSALTWGCPYATLWQTYDAPRLGDRVWGFGVYDARGEAPSLKAPAGGRASIADRLRRAAVEGLAGWSEDGGY